MMLTYDTSFLSFACTFINMHERARVRVRVRVCVCVKALVRFSAWVAASKRWCLIDCTMCRPTRHFVSGPIFYKAAIYYRKVVPLIYI